MFAVQILDRRAVRDHISLKAKIVSEPFGEPVMTAGNRNTVVIVVRTHYAQDPGLLDSGLESRQKDIFDFARRCLWIRTGITLAASLVIAVDRKMFGGRCDRVVFLHCLGHRNTHPRHEIGILAICVLDASPARITRHVQCRGVNVRIAECSRFEGGDATHLTDELLIPCAAHSQL